MKYLVTYAEPSFVMNEPVGRMVVDADTERDARAKAEAILAEMVRGNKVNRYARIERVERGCLMSCL